MAIDLTSSESVLSACRRTVAATLKSLAGRVLDRERRSRSVYFADVHHDDVLRLPSSALGSMALGNCGRVAIVHRYGTSIVELMSEDTYNRLYRRGIDD